MAQGARGRFLSFACLMWIGARAECRDDPLAEMVQWMRNCQNRTGFQ
jgi:hypothetical protein